VSQLADVRIALLAIVHRWRDDGTTKFGERPS
jgi:hypothetical protein